MSAKTLALAILLAAALALTSLMRNAGAACHPRESGDPQPRFTIQCMMITGCWWHPTGYDADFWMWHAIYAHLNSSQYDRVWNTADWRWIPEAAGHAH